MTVLCYRETTEKLVCNTIKRVLSIAYIPVLESHLFSVIASKNRIQDLMLQPPKSSIMKLLKVRQLLVLNLNNM